MQAVTISFHFSLFWIRAITLSQILMWYDSGSTYIEFEDVIVPADNLLGREGQGFEIIMSSMLNLF